MIRESSKKAQQLRELLVVAKKLRGSAAEADNLAYKDLFLRTANALESRAYRLAYDVPGPMEKPEAKIKPHVPVNLLC